MWSVWMSINTILSVKMVYPILQDVQLPCHRQQLYVEECSDGVALKAEWQDHWCETFTLRMHYPFLITILTFCALAYLIIITKMIALKSKSSEWLGTASKLKNNLCSNIFEVLNNKNNIPQNK